jgi:hypothetical protein
MTGITLAAAVRGIPSPPCDGCANAPRCAKKKLACRDFTLYLCLHMSTAPSDRTPSRYRYEKAFPQHDSGEWS